MAFNVDKIGKIAAGTTSLNMDKLRTVARGGSIQGLTVPQQQAPPVPAVATRSTPAQSSDMDARMRNELTRLTGSLPEATDNIRAAKRSFTKGETGADVAARVNASQNVKDNMELAITGLRDRLGIKTKEQQETERNAAAKQAEKNRFAAYDRVSALKASLNDSNAQYVQPLLTEAENEYHRATENYQHLNPSFIGSLGTKIGDAAKGAVEGIGSAALDVASLMNQQTANDLRYASGPFIPEETAKGAAGILGETSKNQQEAIIDIAAQRAQRQADIEKKYENLPEWQKTAGDLVGTVGQVGTQVAASLIPVVGPAAAMTALGASVYGNSYADAKLNGADDASARTYGVMSAALEIAAEKITAGAVNVGKTAIPKAAINAAAAKIAAHPVLNTVVSRALSGVGEGAEEVISEIISPFLERLTIDPNAEAATMTDLLLAFGGGFVGDFVVGGGGDIVNAVSGKRNAADMGSVIKNNDATTDLIEVGLSAEPGTLQHKLAQSMSDKIAVGREPSDAERGNLFKATLDAAVGDTTGDVAKTPPVREGNSGVPAGSMLSPPTQRSSPVSRFAETLGDEGRAVMNAGYDGATDELGYIEEFMKYYRAGQSGKKLSAVPSSDGTVLSAEVANTAFVAGQGDAATSLGLKKNDYANVYSKDGGFIPTKSIRKSLAMDKATARELNDVGKVLGVKIMVDENLPAGVKGVYKDGVVSLSSVLKGADAITEVVRHEVTHHLQLNAPEQYEEFRRLAFLDVTQDVDETALINRKIEEYARDGVTLSRTEAVDELVAEYAGSFFSNTQAFAKLAKEKRNIAQRLLDTLRNLIAKIRGKVTALDGISDVEKAWAAALNEVVQRDTVKATASGAAKFSMKTPVEHSDSLIAVHNLTEGKLKGALELGGLPMPSIAVTRQDTAHSDYGDISLVFGRDTVDPAIKGNMLFGGDAWTPTSPDIGYKLNPTALGAFAGKIVDLLPEDARSRAKIRFDESSILDRLDRSSDDALSVFADMPEVKAAYEHSGVSVDEVSLRTWLAPMMDGVVQKRGIRNEKDLFTPSGNRRNFESLYYEYTLENVVSAMLKEAKKGGKGPFGSSIYGAAVKTYPSITAAKSEASRLNPTLSSSYASLREQYDKRFWEMVQEYAGGKDTFDAADALIETVSSKRTRDSIYKHLAQWKYVYNPSYQLVDNLMALVTDISQMPARYFESKPQRAVGFDEVLGAVVPSSIAAEVRSALAEQGVAVVEYAAGDESARLAAINGIDGAKFSHESESVMSEVKKLRKRNEYLEKQLHSTPYGKRDPAATGRFAREVAAEYSSKGSAKAASIKMQALFDRLATGRNTDGEPLTYSDAFGEAKDIALFLLSNSVRQNNEAYDEYVELRNTLRKTAVAIPTADKVEISVDGGFAAFFRKHRGNMNITDKGMPIDMFYQELSNKYPQFLSKDIMHPAEQLMALGELADSLRPVFENPYSSKARNPIDIDIAAQDLAATILEAYYSIPTATPTYADRQALKIEDIKVKSRERFDRAVERVKKNHEKQVEEIKGRYAEAGERRYNSELRGKIRRQAQRLTTMLTNETDTRHVPPELKAPLAAFLSGVDFSSNRMHDDTKNKLADISSALNRIATGQNGSFDIDPDLADMIDNIRGVLDDRNVGEMSKSELTELYNILTAFGTLVTNSNKLLADEQRREISKAGYSIIRENRTDKPHRDSARRIVQLPGDIVKAGMLDSFTFFEGMGDTMNALQRNLRIGMDRAINRMEEARAYLDDALMVDGKRLSLKEWTGDNAGTTTFELTTGDSITLTPAQVMSFYLLYKQDAAVEHIDQGGMRAAPIVKRTKGGGKHIERTYDPVRLQYNMKGETPDYAIIIDSLTEEQKRVADAIGSFFTEHTAAWGNEVSRLLYGYDKFTVKDYFPIVSDGNYIETVLGEVNDATLKNMGITKARLKHAHTPLIIEDVFDVFTRQVSQMANYNAFVPALSDFQRVYNWKYDGGSVKHALEKKHGVRAQDYIKNFILAVNGGVRGKSISGLSDALLSTNKAAAVGLNLSVILQQPMSIIRAANEINPTYLFAGVVKPVKWDLVKKYAPIARWKDWGYYQMDTGRQMKEIIIGKTGKRQAIIEKGMWFAGKADELAWKVIWNAAEQETANKRADLQAGTDEFYKVVGRRFSDIIDRTQVVDSVFHRTQMMRDGNTGVKMLTAFMAEPMKTYNMLLRAARSGDKRAVARATVTFVLSAAAANAVRSFISAARLDDDETTIPEKWLAGFIDNMVWEVPSMFPYVRDLVSLVKGWDIERMDMSGIAKLVRAVGKMFDMKGETIPNASMGLLSTLGQVTGIPLPTLKRDIEAIHRHFTTKGSVWEYNVEKFYYRDDYVSNRGRFCDILYSAWEKEDKTDYYIIRADMLANPATYTTDAGDEKKLYDEDYLDSAIRSRLKKSEGYVAAAAPLKQDIVTSLEGNRVYNAMPPEQKNTALDKAKVYSDAIAMLKSNPDYTLPTNQQWVDKVRNGSAVGLEPWEYALWSAAYSVIESDKDEDGKTVSGSKQGKVIDELSGMTWLTDKERDYLFDMLYDSDKNNPFD